MDPLVELAKWAPAPLVLYVAYKLANREVARLLGELNTLKELVAKALAEAQNRVTVADHRESMRQVWEAHHSLKELVIEMRAEQRTKRAR